MTVCCFGEVDSDWLFKNESFANLRALHHLTAESKGEKRRDGKGGDS